MPKHGKLRIHSEGGVRLTDVSELLSLIDDTYNAIYAYESILDSLERAERRGFPRFYGEPVGSLLLWDSRLRHLREWPPTAHAIRSLVPSRDRLLLKAAELHSPGFWEVFGSLNPLEVIRKYLADRHERRKDREYREAAEKRRLELENRLLQTQVMTKEAELMQRLGATEKDFAALRNVLLYEPLERLQRLQERGLIIDVDPEEGED